MADDATEAPDSTRDPGRIDLEAVRRELREKWDYFPRQEAAYRRGFQQGYAAALEAVRHLVNEGLAPEEAYTVLQGFLYKELADWRPSWAREPGLPPPTAKVG